MGCSKTGLTAFLGLILMTTGFVLTLNGWFAPPISETVTKVRMAGPIILAVGLGLLLISCFLCALEQAGYCVNCCAENKESEIEIRRHFYPRERDTESEVEESSSMMPYGSQASPLILREMRKAIDDCAALRQGKHVTIKLNDFSDLTQGRKTPQNSPSRKEIFKERQKTTSMPSPCNSRNGSPRRTFARTHPPPYQEALQITDRDENQIYDPWETKL